jgi:predicted SAM-dependent methyltransferase
MTEIKINFGCGGNILEGWTNVDAEVDITKPLPYADNTVDFILAEHVVEHVSGPDALRFFDKCHRILKLHGVLRVCVPVVWGLGIAMTREHARDLILGHGHQLVLTPVTVNRILYLAGFKSVQLTPRKECDGHWKAIGLEKDDLETYRCEAVK